jgi:2'-5' RNA ligase
LRLFVAVRLDEEAMAGVASARAALEDALKGARWASPGTTHLTLRFIGDVPPGTADAIAGAMTPVASTTRAFEFTVAGLGGFPGPGRARVLWAGVSGGRRELADLALKVDAAVRSCGGGAGEDAGREFVPHVTIARLKIPANLQKLAVWAGLKETVLGRCRAARFVLFSSRLTPAGPVHEEVRVYDLA